MKRIATLLLFSILLLTQAWGAGKQTPLYIFGFAASFTDSLVHFTDIQYIEEAYTEKKTGFLYNREDYSQQLREYLKEKGVQTPTCVTFYATKRKKIEKKYIKLRRKYTQGGKYDVQYIDQSAFNYQPVESDLTREMAPKKMKKAEKQARKADKRQKKQQKKELKERYRKQ